MLGLVAISALTLFIVTLFDDAAMGAEAPGGEAACVAPDLPDTLEAYRELVTIGSDGNAYVEVRAVLAEGGSGDLLLPFAFPDSKDFKILSGPVRFQSDDAGGRAPTRRQLGHRMLNLELLETAASGDTVRVGAALPGWYDREGSAREYGEFAVSRSFVNNSAFALRNFELTVELSEGMLVHSITKVVPAYDPKKSPQPPFEIGQRGGRGWATLRVDLLGPAESCRLDLLTRPARRGLLPLIAGLVLVVLYLTFFRDVLKPKEAE